MAKTPKDEVYEDEVVDTKDDLKIDQVPKTYVLLNNYWETIEQNMPKNYRSFIKFIAQYRNKFISRLETPYPLDYPPWLPICNRKIYEAAGIDEDAFVKDVLTIRGWDGYEDSYLKDKAPYILLNMLDRWFLLHNMAKERNIVQHYIGYSHYWAVFTVQFKKYKPKPEVMKYTINEASYKSRLKALGSVDAWLYDGVSSTMKTYDERLRRGSDFELHYINEKIRGKFKSAMKTLYRAQEKNEREKKYVFESKTKLGEDIVESVGTVSNILTIADGFATKFFADPINEEALKGALIPGGITEKDLRNAILLISDDDANLHDVSKLYQSLFHLFLDSGKYRQQDIGTLRFYYEMEKLYKPGNSNDPNKTFIKEILDKWLSRGSATFRTTNRTATITTFRKTIYNYFILKIMKDR